MMAAAAFDPADFELGQLEKPNVKEAFETGKRGLPSPRRLSSHNYHEEELEGWKAGVWKRCEQQYRDLHDQ